MPVSLHKHVRHFQNRKCDCWWNNAWSVMSCRTTCQQKAGSCFPLPPFPVQWSVRGWCLFFGICIWGSVRPGNQEYLFNALGYKELDFGIYRTELSSWNCRWDVWGRWNSHMNSQSESLAEVEGDEIFRHYLAVWSFVSAARKWLLAVWSGTKCRHYNTFYLLWDKMSLVCCNFNGAWQ